MLHRWNWKRIRDGAVNIVITLIILAGLGGYATGLYFAKQDYNMSHEIIALQQSSQTQANLHHTQTAKQNRTIINDQQEMKYLLSVVVFLTGEIHNQQLLNQSELQTIQTVQTQVAELAPIINGLPSADSDLAQLANQLTTAFNALAADVQAACTAAGLSCIPIK